MTPSMGSALDDLELHRLLVVYPGSTQYTLRPKAKLAESLGIDANSLPRILGFVLRSASDVE
jgi:hypothetical protein